MDYTNNSLNGLVSLLKPSKLSFMKNFFLSIFLFFTTLVQSQELMVHKLAPPNSRDQADLGFLKQELSGKRVVLLGEMTHMYGNIFEMKARVVEFLHEEMGFNTIALEASMYDLWLMNLENPEFSSSSLKEAAVVWSKSEEFNRLINYIEANDLKVVGFDSQIFNNTSRFIDDFFDFCRGNNIKINGDEDDFGIAIEEVLEAVQFEEDDISFKKYRTEIEKVVRKIEKLPASEQNFYWLQFTKSLLASSNDAYYNSEEVLTSDLVNSNHNFRDQQMADNLIQYLNRYRDEKVVVWTDNIHAIKDISSYRQPIIKDFVPMGSYLVNSLGDEVYSLATLHANDSLFDGKVWHKTPILEGSFEQSLASRDEPFLFIDSDQKEMKKIQNSRLLSFIDFYEGKLDQLHDGYIFLKTAKLPENKTIDTEKDEAEQKIVERLNKPLEINKKKITRKLIDSKTGEPIPYASIILRNNETYRISDENGNYTLELPSEIDSHTLVTISCMGYESVDIPLNQLEETLKLSPSYEKLNEVVLNGYSTTPKKVLKKAIKRIQENYLLEPFNYQRYGHFTLNKNDEIVQDIELITTEYVEGYGQEDPANQRVEQVRWNKALSEGNYEYSVRLSGFREDAIQFSKILHKRKYKKFDLEFVVSDEPRYQNQYIIKFKNTRDRFGYTNRWYPTSYSGEVYINKEDFAIVKVVQNWETTIQEENMEKYKYWLGKFQDKMSIKMETVSEYKKQPDGKYYASKYFKRSYQEKTDLNGEFVNVTFEGNSSLRDYSQKNLQVLDYDNWKADSALDRTQYDAEFWKAYRNENISVEF